MGDYLVETYFGGRLLTSQTSNCGRRSLAAEPLMGLPRLVACCYPQQTAVTAAAAAAAAAAAEAPAAAAAGAASAATTTKKNPHQILT